MNTFLNEYRNLITECVIQNCSPKQIIDSLYHKEIVKYLRFGVDPRIDEINNTVQKIFEVTNKQTFDFINAVQTDETLFVGEGNFSFSLSIAKQVDDPSNMIVSTNEIESDLSDFTNSNILELESLGIQVLYGIDATRLDKDFDTGSFNNIIFQFPHTGMFKIIEGASPNFTLLREFLTSAKSLLSENGKVIVSIVDSPFYKGVFKIEEVVQITGYRNVKIYDFNPLLFPNYNHKMTNSEESAISSDDNLITVVFEI